MKKRGSANCVKCLRVINLLKDKYVLLGTYDKNKPLNESYFHIQCWHDYFKTCVIKKIHATQLQAMKMLGDAIGGLTKNA